MSQDNIEQLENRVDELIAACLKLKSENELLVAGRDNLREAHDALKERARRARGRIEGVISRLKALERSDRP
ncbi:MAG: TIGR02449 family protein [Acidiferrobacteraceae bacterium]